MKGLATNSTVDSTYPINADRLGDLLLNDGRYELRYVRSLVELDRVLRLRYEVFNLELGEGLEESHATGKDEDEFDRFCHHLMVTERRSGRVIGTYRLQTIEMARAHRGLYTDREFVLSELPAEILDRGVELGRACIAKDHRNRRPLFLLWKGLAHYMRTNGKRYLFGCSSLTSQDIAAGYSLLDEMRRKGQVDDSHFAPVREPYALAFDGRSVTPPEVPTLFRTYLRYGAKVCGGPAIDREFKTIDFLAVLDLERLDTRTIAVFFGGLG